MVGTRRRPAPASPAPPPDSATVQQELRRLNIDGEPAMSGEKVKHEEVETYSYRGVKYVKTKDTPQEWTNAQPGEKRKRPVVELEDSPPPSPVRRPKMNFGKAQHELLKRPGALGRTTEELLRRISQKSRQIKEKKQRLYSLKSGQDEPPANLPPTIDAAAAGDQRPATSNSASSNQQYPQHFDPSQPMIRHHDVNGLHYLPNTNPNGGKMRWSIGMPGPEPGTIVLADDVRSGRRGVRHHKMTLEDGVTTEKLRNYHNRVAREEKLLKQLRENGTIKPAGRK